MKTRTFLVNSGLVQSNSWELGRLEWTKNIKQPQVGPIANPNS